MAEPLIWSFFTMKPFAFPRDIAAHSFPGMKPLRTSTMREVSGCTFPSYAFRLIISMP